MARLTIYQPQDYLDCWRAQAVRDGAASLSEWIAQKCNAALPKETQAKLATRPVPGRPSAAIAFTQRFDSLKPGGQKRVLDLASKYMKETIETIDQLLGSWDELPRNERLKLEGLVDSLE